jgi:sigma-B regulation protein RsbU (phosphoserine phosphatase)
VPEELRGRIGTLKGMQLPRPERGIAARMRRVMPRVAIAAGVLIVVQATLGGQAFIAEGFLGNVLGLATAATILLTFFYYGYRLLRRVTDVLLWRVRRRLIVTYLFIGITPIVLLTVLAFLAEFAVSAEAMARTISVQVNLVVNQAAAGARELATELAGSQALEDEEALREWIRGRAGLLESVLPEARIIVWPSASQRESGAALPGWLDGTGEWAGLTYEKEGPEWVDLSGSTLIRAMARGERAGRAFAVLVEAPAGESLIERLRQNTGLEIFPPVTLSFPTSTMDLEEDDGSGGGEPMRLQMTLGTDDPEDVDLRWESGPETGASLQWPYPVLMSTTDWSTGTEAQRNVLQFRWTWVGAVNYLLGLSLSGRVWRVALVSVGGLFLLLELAAVLAAVWMTRSVTRAVHGMHRATGFIRRGDFSHRIYLRSRDQLGDLAEAFNDMAAHVESLLEERIEKERLQREVEIAATVQAGLFPREVPRLGSVEIAGECRAARGVSGDYYDYVRVGPGQLLLAVGDVSGKGISASLLMSNLQASLRTLAGAAPAAGEANGVARIVHGVSMQLCLTTDLNRFASLFLARYDDERRLLTYTNAGHCAPVLLAPDGTVERLTAGGMIAGSFEDARYEEAQVSLVPGALLVLFSDGISEASAPEGEQYGERRLVEFVSKHRDLGAADLQGSIFQDVEAWTGGGERDDDQTLMVVKARAT